MLMVLGGLAPARLGAPLDAPTFRIVNGLDAADTESLGRSPSDLTKTVVNVLMFTQVNVVSVAELPESEVPDVTQVIVADPAVLDELVEIYEPHFGELEIVPAEVAIEGIDVEIVLGRSFVERLAADPPADVAGSSGDTSGDTSDDTGDDTSDDTSEGTGDGADGDDATDD
jgi:hypothetical protein